MAACGAPDLTIVERGLRSSSWSGRGSRRSKKTTRSPLLETNRHSSTRVVPEMTSRKKPNEREQTPVGHGVEATPLPSELVNYMESERVRTEERQDRIRQEDREHAATVCRPIQDAVGTAEDASEDADGTADKPAESAARTAASILASPAEKGERRQGERSPAMAVPVGERRERKNLSGEARDPKDGSHGQGHRC